MIHQKISSELLERLHVFHNFNPATILDLDCGTSYCLKPLQKTYPEARYFGLERSYEQLLQTKMNASRWSKYSPTFLLGDIEKLPFMDQQFDLICSNLALLWVADLKQCLLKLQKMLKPNGLLIFTMLGVDTFKEFRTHRQANDTAIASQRFVELHHLGDLLMKQKLSEIVVETNYWHVWYNNLRHAHQEVKKMGLDSLLTDGKIVTEQQLLYLEHADVSITWEIVYAQAWRLPPTASQEIAIPVEKIRKT